MTPRVYGTKGRERDFLPLTPALSHKGRGSKVCRAASHAASSLKTVPGKDNSKRLKRRERLPLLPSTHILYGILSFFADF